MRHGLLVGFFLTFLGVAWALTPDATREQVIAELGKPTSVAKLGRREIMIYPGGVRLELEEGKVVAAKGIILTDAVAEIAQPAKAATRAPAAAAPKKEKEEDDEPPLTEKERKQQAVENAAAEKEYSESQAKMMKTVEGMEADHERGQHPAPPKKFSVIGFILGMVLKFLLTVAALKLACKYWGAEVFWDVIFIVSGADALVSGGMNLMGELLLGFPTLFSADDLVGGIVMLFLLKKLSVNHAIGQAIQLTLTTKTFIIVVGSFLLTMVLRLLS